MRSEVFTVVLDGRSVQICQRTQEVCVLDAAGQTLTRELIQVAAGSVQGIFSALQEVGNITTPGAPRHNA